MKVFIGADELYPYYYFRESEGMFSEEIDDDTLARWTRVMEEFEQVQHEMAGWGR